MLSDRQSGEEPGRGQGLATNRGLGIAGYNDYKFGRPTTARRDLSDTARNAIPGYSGHRPTHMKDNKDTQRSDAGTMRKDTPNGSTCGASDAGSSCSGYGARQRPSSTPISQRARRPIPGYQGYVPGKKANNIVGKTHAEASREAVDTHKDTVRERKKPQADIPLQKTQFHGRIQIPGYTGHMHGEVADGHFGGSRIKAAKDGWIHTQREKELGGGYVNCE